MMGRDQNGTLQARKCQRLWYPPEARRKVYNRSSPRAFRESMALPTPGPQTPGLQNCGRIHFCCLKPHGLWQFVAAALGNQYSWHLNTDVTDLGHQQGWGLQ